MIANARPNSRPQRTRAPRARLALSMLIVRFVEPAGQRLPVP